MLTVHVHVCVCACMVFMLSYIYMYTYILYSIAVCVSDLPTHYVHVMVSCGIACSSGCGSSIPCYLTMGLYFAEEWGKGVNVYTCVHVCVGWVMCV